MSGGSYNLDSVLTAWTGGKEYVKSAVWDSWQWVENNTNKSGGQKVGIVNCIIFCKNFPLEFE